MESQIIEDLQKEKVILRQWKTEDSNKILQLLTKLTEQNITIQQLKETKISQVVATISKQEGSNDSEKEIINKSKTLLEKWKSNFKHRQQTESSPQNLSKQKSQEKEAIRPPMLTTDEQKDLEKSKKLDQLKHEKDAKAALEKKKKSRKSLDDIEPKPQKHIKAKQQKGESNIESPSEQNEQNSSSQDGISLKYNGNLPNYDNDTRRKAAEVLYDALQTDFDKNKLSINDKEYIIGVVVGIEKALFEKYNIIDQKYQNDVRKLNANLKNKNNPDFRRKVINQELGFKEVAKVDPNIMTSEKSKQEKQQIATNMFEGRLSDWHTEFLKKNAKAGGCMCINPKCRSTKTLTRLQQTRGADEPMTEFNECLDCGKKWKV